ncbi:TldD/PmbA family protein [Treponema sp. OMZ 792]|uniref:TldD/PmbA family protein n=1 Tax=unclassified Treponema TaxID=2638727 RepID=UPI0020A4358F|nr:MULTISPECIES: TldD/PmbA family protein [unclassified Treponema]UTC74018.1 TldD/PmbA family protein [Treponema sp. OMZ 792]UTC80418.1 TldD/PmbA family protein [Treponema sp. OMZ 798]
MSGFDGIKHAEFILETIKKEGADKAVTRVSKSVKSEMNIDAGRLSLYRSTTDISVAMTSLVESKKGHISGNDLSEKALKENAAKAVSLSRSSEKDDGNDISPMQKAETLSYGDSEPNNEKMYDRLKEFLDYTKSTYPTLQLNQCILDFTRSEKVLANSNGVRFTQSSGIYNFAAMFFAKDGKGTSSFNYSGAAHLNLDKPLKDWGNLDEIMRENCEQTITTPLSGSFTGDIVITPMSMIDFVGTMVGLFMGNMPLITGTSIWKDKLNQKVLSDLFTLHSFPRKPGTELESLYTGDGFKTENETLIEKGVLKDFVLSLYGSKKTGLSRCVSGGEGLIIESGNTAKTDMIKAVKKGILLGRFSGGSPAANGDFSGVAKNSYLIENGKITKPLSETMIAGNIVKMFSDIISVSKEKVDYGNAIVPWMHSTGITISGK